MLDHFPLEVLQQLFDKLYGFDIGALWLTGNRLLAHKMSEGAVQSFLLPIVSRRRKNPFWPSLVSSFQQLRILRLLRDPESSIPVEVDWNRLNELSSSLTSICIESSPATTNYKDTWPSIHTSFPLLTELNIGPIAQMPPNTDAEPNLELPKILAQTSLTSLSIWTRRDALPVLLKNAPPMLTDLAFTGDGPYCLGLGDHVFELPKSFLKISITGLRGTSTFSEKLPPAINSMKLDSTFDKMICQLASQGKLPSTLTSLKLTSFHQGFVEPSVLRGLPSALKTLSLRCRATLTEEAMKLLPLGLTRLDFLGCLGTNGTEADLQNAPPPWELPKGLKILRTNIDANTLRANVNALPAGLQHLQTLNDCSDFVQSLPKNLTFLSCALTPNEFLFLPSTLTFLDSNVLNLGYRNANRKTGSCFPCSKTNLWPSLPSLPASLTRVRCSLQCYSPLDFLPPTLRNLNLRILSPPTTDGEPAEAHDVDPNWALHLPASLVSLILSADYLPLTLDTFNQMACRAKLLTLQLRSEPPKDFDSNIFSQLPPRLLCLILRISRIIDPKEHLLQLPSRVECLMIETDDPNGPGIEVEHLKYLPPRVGEFRLPKGNPALIPAGAEMGISVFVRSTFI